MSVNVIAGAETEKGSKNLTELLEVPSNETGAGLREDRVDLRPRLRIFPAGGSRTGRRLGASLIAGVVSASIVASIAFAAQPKGPACWGPTKVGCSSISGPLGGNLNVSGTNPETIFRFVYAHKCLGMTDNLDNEVDVLTLIPISKSGTFSYKGKGTLLGKPSRLIPVTISGKFMSNKLAKVKLAITYKSCKPVTLTLRYPGR